MKILFIILCLILTVNAHTQYCRAVHGIENTSAANTRGTVIAEVNGNAYFATVNASKEDTIRLTFANVDDKGETSNYQHSIIYTIPGIRYALSGVATSGDDMIISLLAEQLGSATLTYFRYNTISNSITETSTLPTIFNKGYARSRQKGDSLVTYIAHPSGTSRVATKIPGAFATVSTDYTPTMMYNNTSMVVGRRSSELLITESGIEYIAIYSTIVRRSVAGVYSEVALPAILAMNGFTMNVNPGGDLLAISGQDYFMFDNAFNIIDQGILNISSAPPGRYSELFYQNGTWCLFYKSTFDTSIKLVMDNGMVAISEFELNGGPVSPYGQYKTQNGMYIIGQKVHYDEIESIAIIKDVDIQSPGVFLEYSREMNHNALRFNVGHLGHLFRVDNDTYYDTPFTLLHDGIYKEVLNSYSNTILGQGSTGDTIGMVVNADPGMYFDYYTYPGPFTPIQNRSFESFDKYNRGLYIDKDMIDNHIVQITNGTAGYEIPLGIKNWPAHGDISLGQAQNIAPFFDQNTNGVYEPELGDYPSIYGNRCILNIFHQGEEAGPTGLSDLNLECIQYYYVYDCDSNEALMNTVFVKQTFKIYNGSLNNGYMGTWTHLNIGNPLDNFAGTFVDIGMKYAYNADNFDEDDGNLVYFHDTPPAAGVLYLKGAATAPDGLDNAVGIAPGESINGFGFGDGIIDNEYLGLEASFSDWTPFNTPDLKSFYNWTQGKDAAGNYVQANGVDVRHTYFGNSDPQFYSAWGANHGNNFSEITAGNSPDIQILNGGTGPINLDASNPSANSAEILTAYIVSIDSLNPQINPQESVIDLYKLGLAIREFHAGNDPLICGSLFDFYVSPLALAVEEQSIEVSIYPNPTNGELTVQLSTGIINTLIIRDASGRIVYTENPISNHLEINLSSLKAGIYFVKIETDNGTISKKIIKQ